jgi:hypothetical protein
LRRTSARVGNLVGQKKYLMRVCEVYRRVYVSAVRALFVFVRSFSDARVHVRV